MIGFFLEACHPSACTQPLAAWWQRVVAFCRHHLELRGGQWALLRVSCARLAAGGVMASRFELDEQRQLDAADVDQRGWSCPFSPRPS